MHEKKIMWGVTITHSALPDPPPYLIKVRAVYLVEIKCKHNDDYYFDSRN